MALSLNRRAANREPRRAGGDSGSARRRQLAPVEECRVRASGASPAKTGGARHGAHRGLLLAPGPDDAFAEVIQSVSFPAFVAGLIEGVFNAIVNASIDQMEAYADLVTAVAASIGEFRNPDMSDIQVRERLCERFPALCPPADDEGVGRTHSLSTLLPPARGGATLPRASSFWQRWCWWSVNRIVRSGR